MAKDNTIMMLGGGIALFALLATSGKSNTAPGSPKTYTRPLFDGKPSTFIRIVLPYTREVKKYFPQIPIELMIAQGGLESAWGKAAPGNMFFGIKANKNWQGDKQLLKTTEVLPKGSGYSFPEVISITKLPSGKYRWVVRDWFRKYDSPLGSFIDHGKLLSSGRYADNYKRGDIVSIIKEIGKDGYATDPNYVPKLINLADLVRKQINTMAA